jgi:hypothetical protein
VADQVEYEGPARLVSALAQMIEEEGLTASYRPPIETRSVGADMHTVLINVVSTGTTAAGTIALDRALARFRRRFPDVKVRGKHEKP